MVAENSYALENLLPAGTIQLYCDPEGATPAGSTAGESENDWNTLTSFPDTHRRGLIPSSLLRLQELEFLVCHHFLRATWKNSAHSGLLLRIRIYLVPFDLSGLRGCLAARNRDEGKILLPARKALASLLSHTNRSVTAWAGCAIPNDDFEPFLPQQSNVRTLSEIYADLPSPVINESTFLLGVDPRTRRALRSALHCDSPPGMSSLYGYQRRTVARMLQQELDPGVAPDPLYLPIRGIHGFNKTFYLQPSNMEVLSELPMWSQAKGGILCEEMGTGKTCIVLGLIMFTKHQLSLPEEVVFDVPQKTILTPLALRHFPSQLFRRARLEAHCKVDKVHFPSLVELLTHFVRASPEFVGPADHDLASNLHLLTALKQNHPFYHVFEPVIASPRRKRPNRGPRKVYLTSATLVVVPRAILEQWNAEINKHCDGGSIRVLFLDTGVKAKAMPSAQKLASEYDIVLLTHERFAAEKSRCDPSPLYIWCECSAIDEISEVPLCTCDMQQDVSPLIQIRWKRLVVDEGHVSASESNLARLCQELNVERRWIVSGTPTRNLMGLSLGQSEHLDDNTEPPRGNDKEEDSSALDNDVSSPGLVYPCDGSEDLPRPWTRVDRDDLAKLGDMISRFIGVPRFAHEMNVFRKKVAAPLLDPQGPCLGAIQVISQVMSQVMFRHQIQDVERELPEKLPPLKEKTVVLKFQPLAAKTYNVLQAGIAVNAVDSERKDQDYLFHTTARAALRQTLENLMQTMFWRTDQKIFDIDEALQRSQDALQRALKKNLPEADIKLVEESIRVQHDASKDDLWRKVMQHEDNPFVVRGLSSALQDAWLKIDAHLFEDAAALLDPERLCKLRGALLRYPFITESQLAEHGHGVAIEEARRAALYEESQRKSKRRARQDDGGTGGRKVKSINANAGSKEMQQELNRELTAAIHRKEKEGLDGSLSVSFGSATRIFGSLPSIFIGKSMSSKINYILRKVLKHAAKHKFLIFSASPLSLAHVAEALEVAQIPHLAYLSRVEPQARQQTVVTFETSDRYRVLLMELKLGARGLNLVTASRIIFCEPVWQGDVESQAIKRAHRIGQKCSVLKVATLVMQGTCEEAIVTRRHTLRRQSQRLPAMEEDASLSRFLQNPTFIACEDVESPTVTNLDIPLLDRYTAKGSRPVKTRDASELEGVVSAPKRRVAFAVPPEIPDDPPGKRRRLEHDQAVLSTPCL